MHAVTMKLKSRCLLRGPRVFHTLLYVPWYSVAHSCLVTKTYSVSDSLTMKLSRSKIKAFSVPRLSHTCATALPHERDMALVGSRLRTGWDSGSGTILINMNDNVYTLGIRNEKKLIHVVDVLFWNVTRHKAPVWHRTWNRAHALNSTSMYS